MRKASSHHRMVGVGDERLCGGDSMHRFGRKKLEMARASG